MNWYIASQISIGAVGVIAVALTQSKLERRRRWACIWGMAAQPAWFYSAITDGQWGTTIACFAYTYAWCIGVWNHWLQPWINRSTRHA